MNNLSVLKDASEIVHYENASLPVYVKQGNLSAFDNHEAFCHWHEDLEFLKVLHGEMQYDINGKCYTIHEGEAILVNAKAMHYGFSSHHQDCEFYCVLFHPQLFQGAEAIYQTYIQPVLDQTKQPALLLNSTQPIHRDIIYTFDEIHILFQKKDSCYELKMISKLYQIWMLYYQLLKSFLDEPIEKEGEIQIQKQMVAFIYQEYADHLSLQDIANSGNVCRSRCCQIFKQYVRKSPIEFLNAYRIEKSTELLRISNLPIIEIAYTCGFQSPSYFSEMFLRTKGCTPKQFRLYAKHSQKEMV